MSNTLTNKVPMKEKLSFGLYLGGQNIFYNLMVSYLMIFYTDVFGLTAMSVGTLFFIARLWDGINDPIMGVIVNKTNTRWGKYKPYLVGTPFFIAVFTILCFYAPNLSQTGKLIYAYITYISWGMIYTVNDVPIWSFTSLITSDSKERVNIISLSQIFVMVAMILVMLLTIPLVLAIGGEGNPGKGYFTVAVIFSIFGASLMLLSSRNLKQRVKTDSSKSLSFEEIITFLKVNKPLFVLLLAGFAGVLTATMQTGMLYFLTYNIGRVELLPVLGGLGLPLIFFGIALSGKLANKIGKKKALIVFSLFSALLNIIVLFVGYSNLTLYIIVTVIGNLFVGGSMVIMPAMYTDTVDYVEYKTGLRAESLIFSIKTLSAKITSAFGAMLTGGVLTIIGYVANQPQTDFALKGIFAMITIFPATGSILTALIIGLFYKLTDEEQEKIAEELKMRRNNVQ